MTEPTLVPPGRLVETPYGTLFVHEISGDGTPIVLMHGFPDDHNSYERLLPLLGPRRAVAFDWHGYHLHVFETVCGQFGAPDDDDDWGDREDEATVALAQVAAAEKAKVAYTYDFGDDWRHDIVVEKITPAEPGVAYPRCTGGRREAPPEDCGGIWAFNEFPAALDDAFDAGEVTTRLAGLAEVLIPASEGSA